MTANDLPSEPEAEPPFFKKGGFRIAEMILAIAKMVSYAFEMAL